DNVVERLASIQKLIAGVAGGAISTLMLHPLDVAKVRLQVNEGTGKVKVRPKSNRMLGTLSEIYKAKGFRGLYQGLTPNLVGASTAWGFYFFFYEALKLSAQKNDTKMQLSNSGNFTNAIMAGVLTLGITNPIWELYAYERLPGFYKGIVPNLIRSAPASGITFVVYEAVNSIFRRIDQ
ncbi:hypothetical protein Ciccas_012793, partial [Cichlidogyrus casuarinus]